MKIYKKCSSNTFCVPENFDVIEEFKRSRLSVWAGGNDWEAGITAICALEDMNYRGNAQRVWFTVKDPEGLSKSEGYDDKDKEYNEYAKKIPNIWIKAAKKIQKEEGLYSLCLKCFNEALSHKDMKEYVDKKVGNTLSGRSLKANGKVWLGMDKTA